MFASLLTSVPGISEVFDRGLVTYTYNAKMNELGVREETLSKYTAVSRQVADETESGDQESAQETAQVFNTMVECLQQTVSVLGATAVNGAELIRKSGGTPLSGRQFYRASVGKAGLRQRDNCASGLGLFDP